MWIIETGWGRWFEGAAVKGSLRMNPTQRLIVKLDAGPSPAGTLSATTEATTATLPPHGVHCVHGAQEKKLLVPATALSAASTSSNTFAIWAVGPAPGLGNN